MLLVATSLLLVLHEPGTWPRAGSAWVHPQPSLSGPHLRGAEAGVPVTAALTTECKPEAASRSETAPPTHGSECAGGRPLSAAPGLGPQAAPGVTRWREQRSPGTSETPADGVGSQPLPPTPLPRSPTHLGLLSEPGPLHVRVVGRQDGVGRGAHRGVTTAEGCEGQAQGTRVQEFPTVHHKFCGRPNAASDTRTHTHVHTRAHTRFHDARVMP